MYGQIMVPLDGSELAERALPCAKRLAVLTNATLHLVRVVEPLAWTTSARVPINVYDDFMAAETRAATRYLETMREQLAGSGSALRTEHLHGDAAATLLDYERRAGIDLVVLCSHGRSGLVRFALGSVADRLLRHGAAPVLLVRAFGDAVNLGHAVVPLDGSAQAEAALHVVEELAPQVVHEVTLLRVIEAAAEGPEAERYLREAVQRRQHAEVAPPGEMVCWHDVVQGDPAQTILDVAAPNKLVVMATHGRSGLARWALGSVADRVARGGAAGVLLVRTRAAPQAPAT